MAASVWLRCSPMKSSSMLMVDGSMLTSRADVREHNRRNDVIDVGSDPAAAPGRMPARPSGSAARKEVIAGVARGEIPVAPAAATLNPGEW